MVAYQAKDPLEPEDRSAIQAVVDALGDGAQKAEVNMSMVVALHRVTARIAKRLRERDQAVRLLCEAKPQEAHLLAVVRDREKTIEELKGKLDRAEWMAWHAIAERNKTEDRVAALEAQLSAERSAASRAP